MWRLLQIFIFLLMGLWSRLATARFLVTDEQHIDPEQNLNTETWNDKNSYRWSLNLRHKWDDARIGYRTSAGSLNMNRFDFSEDIKVATDPDAVWSLAFVQNRTEDFVEERTERKLVLSRQISKGLHLLLLGDTSTWKEYGDMGVGIRVLSGQAYHVDIVYWSVDHYYNSKKSDAASEYVTQPYTWDIRAQMQLDSWSFLTTYEYDAPFTWQRADYDYQYRRSVWRGRLQHDSAYFQVDGEIKAEAKSDRVDSSMEKSLSRRSVIYEVGIERRFADTSSLTWAAQWLERHSAMRQTVNQDTLAKWNEESSPPWSDRREWALLAMAEQPWSENLDLTYGLFLNRVLISEGAADWNAFEVKAQTGLVIHATEQGRFVASSTWDLDQMQRDFPYDRESFRPWGGGCLQAMLVF